MKLIKEVWEKSHRTYGYRRVTIWIQQNTNTRINHKAVLRLMNKMNIRSVARKRKVFKKLNQYDIYHRYENILNRDFKADKPNQKPHTYRLAGPTCLAGDVIGDYSFDKPLKVGDKLVFGDMAHYTMVKNTMFNGINLPDIVLYNPATDKYTLRRHFTYEDFKNRLS